MKNTYESGAVVGAPSTSGGSVGHPTDGVPGSVAATIAGARWFDMITTELLNVVLAAGLTPDAADFTQLKTALGGAAVTGGVNLFGGLLQFRWGTHTNTVDDETVSFGTPFTTACYGVIPSIVGSNASSNVNVQWNTPTASGFGLHAQAQERTVFYIAAGH